MKKLKYSVLDLASIAEGSTATEAFFHSVELAQLAERIGFNRYWLAEHHSMDGIASSATSILIGHIASHTKTLRVGSGGIMLPNHAPLIIAEQFGTLETLYPGRIDLGLGRAPGTNQETMRAIRRGMSGADNFADSVNELLHYFSPDVNSNSKVRAYPGMGLDIPVWLLGSSLYSAELAGKLGLPYSFASHFAPALMMDALTVYRSNFLPSRYLQAPYVMIGVQAIAAETDEEAEFLATTIYQRFLSLVKGGSLKLQAPVEQMNWSRMEEMQMREKLQTSARGGAEKVKRELLHLANFTQADELMITTDIFDHKKRMRSYEIVAQVLKEI